MGLVEFELELIKEFPVGGPHVGEVFLFLLRGKVITRSKY